MIGMRVNEPKYGSEFYTRTCKSYQSTEYFNTREKVQSKTEHVETGCPFYSIYYGKAMGKLDDNGVTRMLAPIIKNTVTPKKNHEGDDMDYDVVSITDIEDISKTAARMEHSVACFKTFTKRHSQFMNHTTKLVHTSRVHHSVMYAVDMIKTYNDTMKAMNDVKM
jgi:hypothetical protein